MVWYSSLKFAGIKSLDYKPPSDKEQLMYDFYLMTLLPQDTNNENINWALEQAREILVPFMKKEMLDASFYAISCEFRHITDEVEEDPLSVINNPNEETFINDFYQLYEAQKIEFQNLDKEEAKKYKDYNYFRDASVNIIKYLISAMNMEPLQFVTLAQRLFEEISWEDQYGGEAWSKIAEGWLNLNTANNSNEIIVWVDHMYDLQHNSGSIFTKLQSYYKDNSNYGYKWIEIALDHKAEIKSPFALFKKASSKMKEIAAYAIKNTQGVSLQQWTENRYKQAFKSPTDTLNLIAEDPKAILYMPEKNITEACFSTAIRNDANIFKLLPKRIKENSQYIEMIIREQPSYIVKTIIEQIDTKKLTQEAIKYLIIYHYEVYQTLPSEITNDIENIKEVIYYRPTEINEDLIKPIILKKEELLPGLIVNRPIILTILEKLLGKDKLENLIFKAMKLNPNWGVVYQLQNNTSLLNDEMFIIRLIKFNPNIYEQLPSIYLVNSKLLFILIASSNDEMFIKRMIKQFLNYKSQYNQSQIKTDILMKLFPFDPGKVYPYLPEEKRFDINILKEVVKINPFVIQWTILPDYINKNDINGLIQILLDNVSSNGLNIQQIQNFITESKSDIKILEKQVIDIAQEQMLEAAQLGSEKFLKTIQNYMNILPSNFIDVIPEDLNKLIADEINNIYIFNGNYSYQFIKGKFDPFQFFLTEKSIENIKERSIRAVKYYIGTSMTADDIFNITRTQVPNILNEWLKKTIIQIETEQRQKELQQQDQIINQIESPSIASNWYVMIK